MLFVLYTFASLGSVKVDATTYNITLVDFPADLRYDTPSGGVLTNGKYKVEIDELTSIGSCDFNRWSSDYVKIRQRSVAGAVGSTDNFNRFGLFTPKTHYHSTIYGDEDIYLEVTLYGYNGYCTMIFEFNSQYTN